MMTLRKKKDDRSDWLGKNDKGKFIQDYKPMIDKNKSSGGFVKKKQPESIVDNTT